MAFNNNLTITGNITADPRHGTANNGSSYAKFSVAWNNRYTKNGEQIEEAHFYDVEAWGDLADNIFQSLTKGDRVVVTGSLLLSRWQSETGENRQRLFIRADDVSPSLRFATATIVRTGGGATFQPRHCLLYTSPSPRD